MDLTTAAAVLGVTQNASAEEIEEGYRREIVARRSYGDSLAVADDARAKLLQNLAGRPAKPEPPVVPSPVSRPRALAVTVLIVTPVLLLSAVEQALDRGAEEPILVLAVVATALAVVFHRSSRRAFPPAGLIGGWALGIAAIGIIAGVLLDDQLIPLLLSAVAGLVAMISAIRVFILKSPPSTP